MGEAIFICLHGMPNVCFIPEFALYVEKAHSLFWKEK